MKILKKITIVASIILFAINCSKKLDINPVGSLSPETVTDKDIDRLILGAYDAMQKGSTPITTNNDLYYLSCLTEDLSADNLKYRATFFQHGEVDNNAILANNVLISRYFAGPYTYIQRANDIEEIVNKSATIADIRKKEILGEIRYMRAHGYYKLVTLFGGVPIVLNRDIKPVPRNTEAEVYTQIITDLEYAKDNAKGFSDNTKISKEAAKALLARVYLIKGDNASLIKAKQLADEVINGGKFTLSNNYNDIWNLGGNEHIFFINTIITEGDMGQGFFVQHPDMPGSGRAELPVDQSLVNAYEPGDQRKAASIEEINDGDALDGWYCKKFRFVDEGTDKYFISRIAEMYLISAEASFRISNNNTDVDALNRINAVRIKRGLAALTSIDEQKILQERRVEFAFEGLRWLDMKRFKSTTNPAKSVAQVYVEAKGRSINDLLYPIPQQQRDVNNLLTQNPGY